MKTRSLGKVIEGYENKWVAISRDKSRIIAAGKSVGKVVEKAAQKGEKDPVLLKLPSPRASYIL